MTLYINTGSGPNTGDGDSLRTAFNKVNANFGNISGQLDRATHLVQSSTAPTPVNTTTIWFDTAGGRSYIFYDGGWIDTNPNIDYQLPVSSTSTLGGVKIDGTTIQISNTGTISVNGAVGAQGYQGADGAVGAQGSQGYQGDSGGPGAQGADGAVGAQGSQGYQGGDGAVGAQGGDGAVGAQGAQGYQGGDGAVGAQGGDGAVGAQGGDGAVGAQGSQGYQGDSGGPGAQGASGAANLPADATGFLYDNGSGALSWAQPYSLTSSTYSFTLSADGVVRLNGTVFSSGNGGTATTSTLINTVSTSTLKIVAPPTSVYGNISDIAGNVAFDNNFIYYCTSTFGTVYQSQPIQTGNNVSYVYLKQSDFSSVPQPGWLIQNSNGGPIYTVSAVYTGAFLFPTRPYYQLNISTNSLTHTTSTIYLVSASSTAPIWIKTPWGAVPKNSIVNTAQPAVVAYKTIKAYAQDGYLYIQSNTATSVQVFGQAIQLCYGNGQTASTLTDTVTTSSGSNLGVLTPFMDHTGDTHIYNITDITYGLMYRVTAQLTGASSSTNYNVVIEQLA